MSSQPNEQPADADSHIIVELFRGPAGRGIPQFSCTLPQWNFMRELGRTFGWNPVGTTYLPQQGQPARHKPIKHDYHPGDSLDRKSIESDDSAQWAAALDQAQRSPFLADMLQKRAQLQEAADPSTEQSVRVLLQTFIEFARRGPFTIQLRREP
ncbi:MAG: hypothetical protein SXG53_05695 [Pseudomonadota bacterium]|nr:hypothetical protein [Pseudomonadota bacterium]